MPKFDLAKELALIDCSTHYELLRQAGYSDEVSNMGLIIIHNDLPYLILLMSCSGILL